MKFLFIFLTLFISLPSYAQLKVAVVDTGLDISDPRFKSVLCKEEHHDVTNTGLNDNNGHGTHVAGLIKKYARDSDYCLLIIKYYSDGQSGPSAAFNSYYAFSYAVSKGADIVNFSSGGPTFSADEYNSILKGNNTIFIVAAGNDHKNLDEVPYYPACYKLPNIYVVGNAFNKVPSPNSNYGSIIDFWENGQDVISTLPGGREGKMSGTSMSAAIHTGKLIYEKTH